MCRSFNIRVYGLLFKEDKILVTDEDRFGKQFTKFPGGGLEFGEGLIDCLHREFKEELGISIYNPQHIYTTDFYQESAFNKHQQIISVYYKVKSHELDKVKTGEKRFDFCGKEQIFRWEIFQNLTGDDLTFPIDQYLLDILANSGI